MKKFWTLGKISIIILFIIIAMGGPFVINNAYMVGEEKNREEIYITLWGPEEVFGFWGEVVGAGATVIALIYTIMYTEYQRTNERKELSKPHLYTTWNSWEITDVLYKKWDKDCSIIIGKEIDAWATSDYPPIIETIRRTERLVIQEIPENVRAKVKIESADALIACEKNHIIFEYYLKNVGVGTASNIKLLISNKEIIAPLALTVAEDYKILFDIDLTDLKEGWVIELHYNYSNIYGDDNWKQKESFVVYRNSEGAARVRQKFEQMLSLPVKG